MEHVKRERPKHRLLESFDKGQQYVPYIQQSGSTTGNQANAGSSATANTYGAGQTALQNQLGGLYSSYLNGQIPSSFTNPQPAINAYNTNFQTSVAPGLAAQYGAGSPVIGSQNALGLAQLQGNLYNTGVQNYTNALTAGSNYGLTPIGNTGATAGQSATADQYQMTSGINPLAFALQALMQGSQSPSDERFKKGIKSIDKEKAIEQIKELRSVEFNWKEEANADKRLQLGFIAQEVEKVIPEAVSKAGDIYLLDKEVIIPVLVAAVQELTGRLEKVENANTAH